MKNSFDGSASSGGVLEQARASYQLLAEQMAAAITELRENRTDDVVVDRCSWRLQQLQSQLYAVLKMEADLAGKSDTVRGPFAGHELDLDAARSEIRQRLARLAPTGADD